MRRLLLLVFLVTLNACGKSLTLHNLLSNPNQLKAEIAKCQASQNRSQNCILVNQAADILNDLLSQLEEDPEAFGQKILAAEQACKRTKIANTTSTVYSNVEGFPSDPCEQAQLFLDVAALASPD